MFGGKVQLSKRPRPFNIKSIVESNYSLISNKLWEPHNYNDISNKIDKQEWYNALKDELNNMKNLKVYEFTKTVPKGDNIVTPKWVFRYKYNSDNTINKRKARLVVKGFTQKEGINYNKTYSPTLKQNSLRIVTSLAIKYGFNIYQIDIKAAYLYADLDEEVYMEVPEGVNRYKEGFWRLKKALYGLKQSGYLWNNKINKELINIGFKRLKSESCMYVKFNKNNEIICSLTVYGYTHNW